MQKITKIYYSSFNKALAVSFHQNLYQIINESGLTQEKDIKGVCSRYKELIDELQGIVDYSKAFESTQTILETMRTIDSQYRYLTKIFRSFRLDHRLVSEEEYLKLEHEVINAFPLTILRQGWARRLGYLEVLVSHLRSDWMPLLEKTGLADNFHILEEQVTVLNNAMISRSEEKAAIEKGRALRIMDELFEAYNLLALYIEAWSNTEHEDSALHLRQQKSLEVLRQANEIISSTKHSLAVARSNRKRANK